MFSTLNSFLLVLHQSNNLVVFPLVILCMLKCLLDVLMGGIVDLIAYAQLCRMVQATEALSLYLEVVGTLNNTDGCVE